jgi:hypothetical protein
VGQCDAVLRYKILLAPSFQLNSESMTTTKLHTVLRFALVLSAVACTSNLLAQDNNETTQDQAAIEETTADAETLDIDAERSPEVVDGRFVLPPMQAATIATANIGNGKTPEGFRDQSVTPMQSLPEVADQRGETWNWSIAHWSAANTFSYPRYFEDRMLERHGHERFGCYQPLASGARFFATFPMLPYLGAIQHPCECEYTMGYYRPGSCTPAFRQRPPYDRRAIVAESLAVGSAIAIFP